MTEIALIEAYYEKTLSQAERLQFETRMQTDVAFAERVQQQLEFLQNLHSMRMHNKRKTLQAKLNSFHAEMLAENNAAKVVDFRPQPAVEKGSNKGIAALKNLDFQALRRKYIPPLSIAASVAVFTAFCTLYAVDYTSAVEKKQLSSYKQLKKEVDNLKNRQRDLEIKENNMVKQQEAQTQESRFGGTGFAVSSEGLVVTSYHLVQQKPDSIVIESNRIENFRYKADLVYFDEQNDLAILRINDSRFKGFAKLPYTFKNKDADLGEEIFTLAHPKEEVVYGTGVISSQSGYEGATNPADSYQVSIPVNPGYSGSPVFDANGNVLGLIAGKQTDSEGVGFALKSNKLLQVIDELPDSVPIQMPQQNKLAKLKRTQQLKKIQDFVFQVKVY
jgi:serine protease Do